MKYYTVEELLNDGVDLIEGLFGEQGYRHGGQDHKTTCGCSSLPVYENKNDDGMVISIEVPGLKEESIDIDFKDDVLTVVGHYGDDNLRKKGDYKFARTYKKVDAEKISASMKDGIINITLPDTEDTKARKINIE